MQKITHLVKLSVGTESIEDLTAWQDMRAAQTGDNLPRHVTRMWPKRGDELTAGGSIYWIIKGQIQCRQRVLRLDEIIGQDGIRRCAMVLDPALVRTATVTKRPFQGWRYLAPADAPPDISGARETDDTLPAELSTALAEIGVL